VIRTLETVTDAVLAELAEEMAIRQTKEVFTVFSFGSQYDHLIKLRLAQIGVFAVVADPARVRVEDIEKIGPKGIILSGGPGSMVVAPPPFDDRILEIGIPVLGICLGLQKIARHAGNTVTPAAKREFGVHELVIHNHDGLFAGLDHFSSIPVLESHGDRVEPDGNLVILASTDHAPAAAARWRHLWGVQFHPETTHTPHGTKIFENFCFGISGAKDRFPAKFVAAQKISEIQRAIGSDRILLALSGGSDSSVVAHLVGAAVGEEPGRVRAIYIKGVDRPDDEAHVIKHFGNLGWLELKIVDATDELLTQLAGIESMPEKRRAFKVVYPRVLVREALAIRAPWIGQGTLYTDNVESGLGHATGARHARIKEHHNTGLAELVAASGLRLLEPLDTEVKDTARAIGYEIGVPVELLERHPFPGPGQVVRIEGPVTAQKLALAHTSDGIFIEELRAAKYYETAWQAGAVVTDINRRERRRTGRDLIQSKTAEGKVRTLFGEALRRAGLTNMWSGAILSESVHTGAKGDDAALGRVAVLWAAKRGSGGVMRWHELPEDVLRIVSRQITDEVPEVGAVVYSLADLAPHMWPSGGSAIALWAVTSTDGFTAEWAGLPFAFLHRVAVRIMTALPSVPAVVYRISGKPPATIEWG